MATTFREPMARLGYIGLNETALRNKDIPLKPRGEVPDQGVIF